MQILTEGQDALLNERTMLTCEDFARRRRSGRKRSLLSLPLLPSPSSHLILPTSSFLPLLASSSPITTDPPIHRTQTRKDQSRHGHRHRRSPQLGCQHASTPMMLGVVLNTEHGTRGTAKHRGSVYLLPKRYTLMNISVGELERVCVGECGSGVS
jgi:hypothetical protein